MNARLALPLIALSLALAGCGNKGPLVLADKPAAEAGAATAEPVAPESTIESTLDQEVDDAKSEVDGDG